MFSCGSSTTSESATRDATSSDATRVVVESVDVVEEAKVVETKATMEAPKAAEHLGLCLMV